MNAMLANAQNNGTFFHLCFGCLSSVSLLGIYTIMFYAYPGIKVQSSTMKKTMRRVMNNRGRVCLK